MNRQPLRLAILDAERILTEAGVASPRVDAELLAAHVLGIDRGKLPMTPLVDRAVVDTIATLVTRRARREPLQHLTGTAHLGPVDLAVGPGVFIPRPETELLLEWGLKATRDIASPIVLDLCTGSGALALAYATARPDARVTAVERDPVALSWARKNADTQTSQGKTPIHLLSADATDPTLLTELDGEVHLILCNPPYVPEYTDVPPEVRDHDPHKAVFSGPDGLTTIRALIPQFARLLHPTGAVAVEHDDSHADSVPALFAARTVFTAVTLHHDLAGRPRFTTAQRNSPA